jgi:hypothetical protein
MLANVLNAHQDRLTALSAFNNDLNEGLPTLQEQAAKLRKLVVPEPTVPGTVYCLVLPVCSITHPLPLTNAVPSTPSRKPLGLHTPSRVGVDAG